MAEERKHPDGKVVSVERYDGRCKVQTHVDSKGHLVVMVIDPTQKAN